MEDIYVIFNNGHFELMADMVIKGKEEKKEQFATAMGKIDESGNLKVEDFDIWDSSLLSQSETTVSPKSQKKWDSIAFNIKSKNTDFIITLHTHPEWYGTNPYGLDETDKKTFKSWTKMFNDFDNNSGVICINGIVADNGGLLLTVYDEKTNRFIPIKYKINERSR